MKLLAKWIIFSLAVYGTAYLLPGIHVPDFTTAFLVAAVLGIINAILKPILKILTLPLTILTLGLFTFILNAVLVLLAAQLVPGFIVDSFSWALLFSFVVSTLNTVLNLIFHKNK